MAVGRKLGGVFHSWGQEGGWWEQRNRMVKWFRKVISLPGPDMRETGSAHIQSIGKHQRGQDQARNVCLPGQALIQRKGFAGKR